MAMVQTLISGLVLQIEQDHKGLLCLTREVGLMYWRLTSIKISQSSSLMEKRLVTSSGSQSMIWHSRYFCSACRYLLFLQFVVLSSEGKLWWYFDSWRISTAFCSETQPAVKKIQWCIFFCGGHSWFKNHLSAELQLWWLREWYETLLVLFLLCVSSEIFWYSSIYYSSHSN